MQFSEIDPQEEIQLDGASISDGIAIGAPYLFEGVHEQDAPALPISVDQVEKEIERYRYAILLTRDDLQKLQSTLASEGLSEAVSIISTHLQMLQDPMLTIEIEEKIRKMLLNSEAVFRTTTSELMAQFSSAADTFFRQRLVDILDVSRRILAHLRQQPKKSVTDIPPGSVLIAREIAPSDTAAASGLRIHGFVSLNGGANSHAALIARSKGIPFVSSISLDALEKSKCTCMIVDGNKGKVILNPSAKTLEKYREIQKHLLLRSSRLEKERQLRGETIDGYPVTLRANIGSEADVELMHSCGAEGIGLVRTEVLYTGDAHEYFSEEMQYEAFRRIIESAQGLPVNIRLFDFGGDKHPPASLENPPEANPLLGCRGVRFLLRRKEFCKIHLRALLRASVHGDVRLLVPLVSDAHEVRQIREFMQEAHQELEASGILHARDVSIGCMLEIPSALLTVDAFAAECDFFSIGTNDLTQYVLGADRTNPMIETFYQVQHPSVLRLIHIAVRDAKKRGRPIAVCGEMASNPLFTPLFLGLGIQELSCAPRFVPLVKRVVRNITIIEAYALVQKIFELTSASAIAELLHTVYRDLSPEEV